MGKAALAETADRAERIRDELRRETARYEVGEWGPCRPSGGEGERGDAEIAGRRRPSGRGSKVVCLFER